MSKMGQVLSFIHTVQRTTEEATTTITTTTTTMLPIEEPLLPREVFLEQLDTYYASLPQPRKERTNPDDDDCKDACYICWQNLANHPEDGEELPVLLHGTHLVGESCIRHWLSQDENNTCPVCRIPVCLKPAPRLKQAQTFCYDTGDARIYMPVGSHMHVTIETAIRIIHEQPTIDSPISDAYIVNCRADLLDLAEDLSDFNPPGARLLLDMADELLGQRFDWYYEDPRLIVVDTTAVYKVRHALDGGASATLSFEAMEEAITSFHQKHLEIGLERVEEYQAGSPALDPGLPRMYKRLLKVAKRLEGQTMTCDKFMGYFQDIAPQRLLPPLVIRANNVFLNRYSHDMIYVAMRACGAK